MNSTSKLLLTFLSIPLVTTSLLAADKPAKENKPNAHCQAPLSGPSRASLMSGL